MLPYVEQPVLELGSYRLEAFPVLVGLAIVTQFQIVMARAPKVGFERIQASSLVAWAIFLGIVGAHLFDVVAYAPDRLIEDPLELLRVWGGLSSFGGMLGGIVGLYVLMLRRGMSGEEMVRFLDVLIYALPFTLAVGRLGCALQHDHPGVSSTHWLAVAFPDGPRFDLGLLEFLYMVGVGIVFSLLGRRRWPDGFFIGLFFALYGPVRFAMDALRVSDARYAGWTPGQYLSVASTLIGLAVLAWLLRRRGASPASA